MLKQMREGAKSTVLKLTLFGLLLMAMAGLALLDVQGMFRRGVSSTTVFSVGREKVSAPQFDHLVQQALRAQQMKQADAYRAGLPQQILKREIDSRIFGLAAHDAGIEIDDALAAKQVRAIIAPLVAKGALPKDALQRLLQAYNMSEPQLVATLKEQMATQALLGTLTAGARAPQALVADLTQYRNEWRKGQYFTLGASDIGAIKDPTEQELHAYYDEVAAEYALPEYRTLSVIVIDKNSLGADAKVSEDKARRYYDDNIADFSTPEARVISQAVAKDKDTADKIYAAVMKDKNLKAAADANKASFVKGASVVQSALPAELAKPAFTGAAGTVQQPVQSPLGWHVLYVEKVQPGVAKPFSAVKAEIAKELEHDSASEALYQLANKIDDEVAGGKTLAEVAKSHAVPLTVIKKVDARGVGADGKKADAKIPLMDKVLETGFGLHKGSVSQLIETPQGAFMMVSADDIVPSEQQSFEKVRSNLAERWMSNARVKALSDKAARLMERLKSGEPITKLAGEFKKPLQETALVQRGTKSAGLSDGMMSALFNIDTVGHATTVSGDNSITVMGLAGREIKQSAQGAKEAEALAKGLTRALQEDILEQYRMGLIAKYGVTINDRLIAEMYTPKDDADHGD